MSESLFTGQTPANPDAADGNTIVTATVVRFAVDGAVSGIRWYGPTVVGVTAIGGLFTITGESTGTELDRQDFGAVTGGAWNTTMFDAPVAVTAGVEYVAAVWSDHYVFTSNLFNTEIVNGNIAGIADNDPFHNGRFLFPAGDLAFPPSTFGKSAYFVDVLFDASESHGVGAANLGALTATGTGSRSRTGTGLASLGALIATATGLRSREGAASSGLGTLVAAASGAASRTGAGESALGALFAHANLSTPAGYPLVTSTNRVALTTNTDIRAEVT